MYTRRMREAEERWRARLRSEEPMACLAPLAWPAVNRAPFPSYVEWPSTPRPCPSGSAIDFASARRPVAGDRLVRGAIVSGRESVPALAAWPLRASLGRLALRPGESFAAAFPRHLGAVGTERGGAV